MALRGRKIENFDDISLAAWSRGQKDYLNFDNRVGPNRSVLVGKNLKN